METQGLVREESNREKKVSFSLSASKKARCLVPLSLRYPRKIKVRAQTEKRKNVLCCLEKRQIPKDSSTDIRGGHMGSSHTKGSQDIPKIIWRVTGFPSLCFLFLFCFVVCVFPLLLGHMLLTRFSAQEKRKRVQSNGDGEQELEKVLDKREK